MVDGPFPLLHHQFDSSLSSQTYIGCLCQVLFKQRAIAQGWDDQACEGLHQLPYPATGSSCAENGPHPTTFSVAMQLLMTKNEHHPVVYCSLCHIMCNTLFRSIYSITKLKERNKFNSKIILVLQKDARNYK